MADSSSWKLIDSYFVFKEHRGISALAKQAVIVLFIALVKFCLFSSDNAFTKHRQIISTTVKDEYDYLVVGGGSAGSVLAARLSEDGKSSVLVIEAGGFYDENPLFHIPFHLPGLQNTKHDWRYYTVPQKESCLGLKENKSFWPRGKVLGGTSMINTMYYARGSRYDYDSWAADGCTGWSYDDVFPYFLKSEDIQIDQLKLSPYHRSGGLLTVSSGEATPLSELYLQAGQELGYIITDYNGPDQIGFNKVQITTKTGVRGSTGVLYLGQPGKKVNLDIVIETMATKIDIKDKRARGVYYVRKGQTSYVKARKEVILTAGAINSPQLLMLSGIGPKEHLQSLDIPVEIDLPVGDNLQDHLSVMLFSKINKTLSLTDNFLDGLWSRYKYKLFGKGPYSSTGVEASAFFYTGKEKQEKVSPNLQAMIKSKFISTNIWNIKDIIAEEYLAENGNTEGISFSLNLIQPRSVGSLRLRTGHPLDSPLIDPQYLTNRKDIDDLIEGVRIWEKFINTKTMQGLGTDINEMRKSFCSQHDFRSDSYWECFIRHLAVTNYHPSGTCKMGADDDPTAVVDSKLRVKGVKDLRVVDASVLSTITAGSTYAPVIMIAEKAFDIINNVDLVKHLRDRT
ncbi:glucose dehydrogenase [FAD, quinone]-like [Mercenaria mercenaria]|uniref:glucose dehydrogenase [FAD, quinone]-like n=1 Tax=Mercenaria mercenaria TaxID=6596 RepID=UPI00234EF640|nr:glucose dehydrogenase [FAD, quinone]-like [Mercenaria mercenaria]